MAALSLEKIREHVRHDIIIGKPVELGDFILVPIIDVFLMAGFKGENSPLVGTGVAGEVTAAAILVIKGEEAELISTKESIDMERLRALVPDILKKINMRNKDKPLSATKREL
jgi:uncharacterized spore protein YtfJ